jgi:hypothetical protein
MPRKKIDKPSAYAWVAYMITHQPEEMARVRRYKTPSDTLIKLSEQPTGMTTVDGKFKLIIFPESLNTRKGQKLLYDVLLRIDEHLKAIPVKAYHLLQHAKATLTHRRSDTLRNLLMVAEAILHRAACEFKTEVLFAFDSINVWVKSVYGKELGYQTLHKALEMLVEAKLIKVNEWGKRGNRSKATKIEILTLSRNPILTYTSDVDDWLLYNDHAMTAVYRRESTTRQDVLENAIHRFADGLIIADEDTEFVTEFLTTEGLGGLLGRSNAKMVTVETTEIEVTDDYFAGLLGRMVPSLQEGSPNPGQAIQGIRKPSHIGKT